MAKVSFCWQLDDGSFAGPADQGEFEVIPLVGDRVVLVTADDDPDAVEVVERYIVDDGEFDVWHLIVKPIDLRPEIVKALGLSGKDTKKRWENLKRQDAERAAAAKKRLDQALKEKSG